MTGAQISRVGGCEGVLTTEPNGNDRNCVG
nr:MAG TPA: hypothetical protein [Caudoviricetes sp.]